jgi:hypothetical protein
VTSRDPNRSDNFRVSGIGLTSACFTCDDFADTDRRLGKGLTQLLQEWRPDSSPAASVAVCCKNLARARRRRPLCRVTARARVVALRVTAIRVASGAVAASSPLRVKEAPVPSHPSLSTWRASAPARVAPRARRRAAGLPTSSAVPPAAAWPCARGRHPGRLQSGPSRPARPQTGSSPAGPGSTPSSWPCPTCRCPTPPDGSHASR